MTKASVIAYLLCLFLLPWTWFPSFPWLHVHAQWSDAFLALAVVLWGMDRWRAHELRRLRVVHVAMGAYLIFAGLSLVHLPSIGGTWKLLGMASLVGLAVLTADFAARPAVMPLIGRTVASTSLLTAAAAVAGVVLFFCGLPTALVGTYGDLVPGAYARAQGGLYHPNLLASYCIFASAVVALPEATLAPRLRRAVQISLGAVVLLTLSRGIVAFGLAVLVRRAREPRGRRAAVAYSLVAIALLAALTFWNVSLDPLHPLESRVEPRSSSRWQAATSAWRTLVAHPLFGSGPGTSPGKKDGMAFDAHLTPLNIAATLGLPALAAFVAIPFLLWRERRRPTKLALWGALAGVALDGLAQDIEDFRHVWVLFGLAAADRGPTSP